jgi:anti-sigma-K factor RskA
MNHDEAQELLAVYALNAVEGQELLDLERHVDECVRCSSELDALRGVTSAMGNVSEPASPEIWQRISEHLYDVVDPSATTRLRAIESPLDLVGAPIARRETLSRRSRITVAFAAAAAAALVGVLSFSLVQANHHVSQLTSALGVANRGAVVAAQAAPGHVDVTLSNSQGANLATFVLLNGHGYLISSRMPTLSSAQTYQLWGIIDGKPISIGLMGTKPTDVAFTVISALTPSEFAVTVEPAGGTSTPTTPIIASGMVTA